MANEFLEPTEKRLFIEISQENTRLRRELLANAAKIEDEVERAMRRICEPLVTEIRSLRADNDVLVSILRKIPASAWDQVCDPHGLIPKNEGLLRENRALKRENMRLRDLIADRPAVDKR